VKCLLGGTIDASLPEAQLPPIADDTDVRDYQSLIDLVGASGKINGEELAELAERLVVRGIPASESKTAISELLKTPDITSSCRWPGKGCKQPEAEHELARHRDEPFSWPCARKCGRAAVSVREFVQVRRRSAPGRAGSRRTPVLRHLPQLARAEGAGRFRCEPGSSSARPSALYRVALRRIVPGFGGQSEPTHRLAIVLRHTTAILIQPDRLPVDRRALQRQRVAQVPPIARAGRLGRLRRDGARAGQGRLAHP
jgi:hypothetical protein